MDKEETSVKKVDSPRIETQNATRETSYAKAVWKERLQDWLFLFGPFVLLLGIFVIGTFFVLKEFFPTLFDKHKQIEAERAAYVEPLNPMRLPSSNELLSRVVTAHGGRRALKELYSIQMNGKIELGDQDFNFYLTRKTPGLALLKIKSSSHEVTDGATNGVFWRRTEVVGQPTQYKLLGEDEVSNLGKDIDALYDPLLTYALSDGLKTGTIRKSSYNREATYLFLFDTEDGRELQAEINADTFFTVAIREPLVVQGEKQELLMHFGDYRKVGDIYIPYQTELFLDSEPLQRIVVDTVKTNYGVLSSLFDLPDQLKSISPVQAGAVKDVSAAE